MILQGKRALSEKKEACRETPGIEQAAAQGEALYLHLICCTITANKTLFHTEGSLTRRLLAVLPEEELKWSF